MKRFSFAHRLSQFTRKRVALLRHHTRVILSVAFLIAAVLMLIVAVGGQQITLIPNGTFFANSGGASETYSTTGGGIDLTGPFFQSLGTNGRTCGSCHQPSDGMSISAANV